MATGTALNQKVKSISGEFCKWFTDFKNLFLLVFATNSPENSGKANIAMPRWK
jgi:hypothetical protein